MKKRRILSGILMIGLVALMAGCKNDTNKNTTTSSETKQNSFVTDTVVEDQLALPQMGEEVAVFNVEGYGSFTCRLFKDAAPKAVENFVTLAKEGKYNGVPFHRVIEDFMIQSGDTTQNGSDGKSIYNSGFEVELNSSLHHYNGALAVARTNSYATGQGTQFYIVSSESAKDMTDEDFDDLESQVETMHKSEGQSDIKLKLDEKARNNYKNIGGYPSLDMSYTVFGQTFKGQDVVDKIAKCPKDSQAGIDGSMSSPNPKVILKSVEIVEYNG